MRYRFPTLATVFLGVLVVATSLGLWGCGAVPTSTTTQPLPMPSSTTSAPASKAASFEEAWTASLDALEALGPTRVKVTETVEGKIQEPGASYQDADAVQQTTEAEQLLDMSRGRTRLTVYGSDGSVQTTVVVGKERISIRSGSLTTAAFVSASRYISLEPPVGLPIPLWAGNAVAPTQGYSDLLTQGQADTGADGQVPEGTVEGRSDGRLRLSWTRSGKGMTSAVIVELNADRLPVSIRMTSRGTPTEGELQGATIDYSLTIEYQYEKVAFFADSDFILDVPADAYREGITYELALDRPWSEQADWGQYWLGVAIGDWKRTTAQYAVHEDDPALGTGAEPRDEGVFLIYERPDKPSPNENIQVIVRPLRGRYFEDSRTFAEQRVTSGDWQRQEMTLAGRPATVYSGPLEGGADSRIDTIYVFLPDALVGIDVWAPIDPRVVLEALSPLE